ncbi:UNVERIFIED_CONTAM: hypothetical protein FKN15_039845 [Acipenser sinensis]
MQVEGGYVIGVSNHFPILSTTINYCDCYLYKSSNKTLLLTHGFMRAPHSVTFSTSESKLKGPTTRLL